MTLNDMIDKYVTAVKQGINWLDAKSPNPLEGDAYYCINTDFTYIYANNKWMMFSGPIFNLLHHVELFEGSEVIGEFTTNELDSIKIKGTYRGTCRDGLIIWFTIGENGSNLVSTSFKDLQQHGNLSDEDVLLLSIKYAEDFN